MRERVRAAGRQGTVKQMKSEIIAIGSEMLTPFRQDTNSLYVTERLNTLGVVVAFKTIVGDRRKDLEGAIRTALGRVDVLVIMGGLGPTEDDLTREAVGEALGLGLTRDEALVEALQQRAKSWQVPMPENNLKQADVLEGAVVLPNPNGSAVGQWLDTIFEGYRKLVALLPGPPHECKPLFDAECMPRLKRAVPPYTMATRTLRAAMLPESQADKLLAPIYQEYEDVETTILAHSGDIQLTVQCVKADAAEAEQRVEELAGRLEEALGDWLYSSDGESLEQIVLYYLGLRQATLATAESCTGGMVAARITDVPGASRSYLGGAVVYTDLLKTSFAEVPASLIAQYGAVSAEVAKALAEGIRKRTGATLGLGITGFAGPGSSETQSVGQVYVAVADAQKSEVIDRNFRGDRLRVREWASQMGLDLVRRWLM